MPVLVANDPLSMLSKAGTDTTLLTILRKAGKIKCFTALQGIKFVIEGEIVGALKFPLSADKVTVQAQVGVIETAILSALGCSKMAAIAVWGNAGKAAVMDESTALLSDLESAASGATPAMDLLTQTVNQKVSGGLMLPPAVAGQVVAVLNKGDDLLTVYSPNAPAYPICDDLKATPVALRDAVGLYQPVKGTSPSSRYFLVADFGDLKLAARYNPGNLSMRFEGAALAHYSKLMVDLGFKMQKEYASLHLNTATASPARKAIGAVILGTGLVAKSPMPDMAIVAGASS